MYLAKEGGSAGKEKVWKRREKGNQLYEKCRKLIIDCLSPEVCFVLLILGENKKLLSLVKNTETLVNSQQILFCNLKDISVYARNRDAVFEIDTGICKYRKHKRAALDNGVHKEAFETILRRSSPSIVDKLTFCCLLTEDQAKFRG